MRARSMTLAVGVILATSGCAFTTDPVETTADATSSEVAATSSDQPEPEPFDGPEPQLGEPAQGAATPGAPASDKPAPVIGADDAGQPGMQGPDAMPPGEGDVAPLLPMDPTIEAATSVSQAAADQLIRGDFRGLYAISSMGVREAMTVDDFESAMQVCAAGTLPITVAPGELRGPGEATTTWDAGAWSHERIVVMEPDGWRVGPSPVIAEMAGQPVDQIIATMNERGSC